MLEGSRSGCRTLLFVDLIFVLVAGIAMRDVIFAGQIGVGGGIALTLGGLLLVGARARGRTG